MAKSTLYASKKALTRYRSRRVSAVLTILFVSLVGGIFAFRQSEDSIEIINSVKGTQNSIAKKASDALAELEIKGRASNASYERRFFGNGWQSIQGCDMRNRILARDLTDDVLRSDGCVLESGTLNDPYTAQIMYFKRGNETSALVQIDHVVALSDAWQKGAQQWSEEKRIEFANDPLNLLAVEGRANMDKGNGDAATWLPPHKGYRCRYVARQIAVKLKYMVWVTSAESDAMRRVLATCPGQVLPITE